MKNTTRNTKSTTISASFEEDVEKRIVDLSKINPISNFDDFESRLSEGRDLAALLKELVCPSWLEQPWYSGSKKIIAPFTCDNLSHEARQGLGWVAMRVESTLMECYQALYGDAAKVDKSEVTK